MAGHGFTGHELEQPRRGHSSGSTRAPVYSNNCNNEGQGDSNTANDNESATGCGSSGFNGS